MNRPASVAVAICVAAAVVAALCVVPARTAGTTPASATRSLQARALASAPRDLPGPLAYSWATVRQAAEQFAAFIPLPDGGTYGGIQWERLEGLAPASFIDATLEYNAACQWLRARRDRRDRGLAQQVLSTVAKWPALRGSESAVVLRDAIAGGPQLRAVLADCDASHRREVTYARHTGRRLST